MASLIRFFAVLITALAAATGMVCADDGITPRTPAGIPSALKGLQLEAGSHMQGAYYTRRWISIGIRREF